VEKGIKNPPESSMNIIRSKVVSVLNQKNIPPNFNDAEQKALKILKNRAELTGHYSS